VTEALATVHLLGIPVGAHRRASEHNDTLRRELALVGAGDEADAGARLNQLSDELQGRFGAFTTAQEQALADAADSDTLDLAFEVPVEAADGAERLGALLDEVDERCRSGELVTLVAPPEAVAYRRWFLSEFVAQIRHGAPPQAWPGHRSAEPEPAGAGATAATDQPAYPERPLFVDGDLDLFGAPSLRAAVVERLEAGASVIVVDLSACTFIDSVGLSLLLTTRERCRATGGALRVVGAQETTLRLFETAGVKDLLVSP
jgi:anti-sigma B factor antagonist